jgi:hypothetical protein
MGVSLHFPDPTNVVSDHMCLAKWGSLSNSRIQSSFNDRLFNTWRFTVRLQEVFSEINARISSFPEFICTQKARINILSHVRFLTNEDMNSKSIKNIFIFIIWINFDSLQYWSSWFIMFFILWITFRPEVESDESVILVDVLFRASAREISFWGIFTILKSNHFRIVANINWLKVSFNLLLSWNVRFWLGLNHYRKAIGKKGNISDHCHEKGRL